MKAFKTHLCYLIITSIVILLNISCSSDDSAPTNGAVISPLKGTNWKLESIKYSYSDSLVDPLGWKEYIVNSGIVTTIGQVNLTISDSSFTLSADLDNFYSLFWGTSDLIGICSGSTLVSSDILIFTSSSSLGIFNLGKTGQEAYANYQLNKNKLMLIVTMPVYLKVSYQHYQKVGDEFYKCEFVDEN